MRVIVIYHLGTIRREGRFRGIRRDPILAPEPAPAPAPAPVPALVLDVMGTAADVRTGRIAAADPAGQGAAAAPGPAGGGAAPLPAAGHGAVLLSRPQAR